MTTDLDGKRAFVMTMRAREQDIRRDKAASNICTNQALLALAASVYLATIGPHGLRDVAALGAARAAELESALAAVGVKRLHTGPYLNEFVVSVPDASAVHRRLIDQGFLAGLVLADAEPVRSELSDGLLLCATEVTTSDEIARFAPGDRRRHRRDDADGRSGSMSVVGTRLQPTLFERSRPGRGGGKIPHPPKDALDRIPNDRAARDAAGAARDERTRRRPPLRQPVAPELRRRYGVLPARLVHDEVQPEAQRMGRSPARFCRPSPVGAR